MIQGTLPIEAKSIMTGSTICICHGNLMKSIANQKCLTLDYKL